MKGGLLLLAALALGGCHDDDNYDPTVPTAMERVGGNGQSGETGELLGEPLSVVVLNLEGDPVAGVEVEWFVASGGGTLSAPSTTTDDDGLTSVTLQLGPTVGEQRIQAVRQNIAGSPVNFTFTARAPSGGGGGGGGEEE